MGNTCHWEQEGAGTIPWEQVRIKAKARKHRGDRTLPLLPDPTETRQNSHLGPKLQKIMQRKGQSATLGLLLCIWCCFVQLQLCPVRYPWAFSFPFFFFSFYVLLCSYKFVLEGRKRSFGHCYLSLPRSLLIWSCVRCMPLMWLNWDWDWVMLWGPLVCILLAVTSSGSSIRFEVKSQCLCFGPLLWLLDLFMMALALPPRKQMQNSQSGDSVILSTGSGSSWRGLKTDQRTRQQVSPRRISDKQDKMKNSKKPDIK